MNELRCTRRAGDWRCTNNAEPGSRQCSRHMAKKNRVTRERGEFRAELLDSSVARPAWMDNPALLPKRPPGR